MKAKKEDSTLKHNRGQALVETAITLPIILFMLMGMVEIVFIGRAYLALLEASVVGARLGTKGEFYFDDNDIYTLTSEVLDRGGYVSDDLVDILIVRADLVDGIVVKDYRVASLKGSGMTPKTTSQVLLDNMVPGDPTIGIVAVEIIFNHHLLFGYGGIVPDPFVLRALTLQPVHPE